MTNILPGEADGMMQVHYFAMGCLDGFWWWLGCSLWDAFLLPQQLQR